MKENEFVTIEAKPYSRRAVLALSAILAARSQTVSAQTPAPPELDFTRLLRPSPASARFEDPGHFTWGGSMVRSDDGKFHLFYSRWKHELTFQAWATHSEIAHAVADSPLGEMRFSDLTLPERGAEFWDGHTTHNPTIHRFEGRHYLYYMGNIGDRALPPEDRYWSHRNRQRIGVAVADSPSGPWKRFDKPLLAPSEDKDAPDGLIVMNPSVTRRPDGSFLLVYKCAARKRKPPMYGPVVHMTATSASPTGPFVKQEKPIFTVDGADFPAEDPYVWYHASRGRYYAIVKDMRGFFTNAGRSLVLMESPDGFDWKLAAKPLVSTLQVQWQGGRTEALGALERPQLYFEDGEAAILLCAAHPPGGERTSSFNVRIQLSR